MLLHPADAPFFVGLCKTLGKPVNFVPVIDKDVRRWWRSDSLWQAHDARYTADQVCVIPGTAAVAGITRVDEPVGELLDRFEKAAVDEVLATGVDAGAGRLPAADFAPTSPVRWASCWIHRTCCGPVGPPSTRCTGWRRRRSGRCTTTAPRRCHHGTGARLEVVGDDRVVLSVPLSGTWIDIAFTLPPTVVDGGAPMVITADAAAAMRAVLAIAAGRRRAPMRCRNSPVTPPRSPSTGIPNGSPTTPASPRRSARRWRPTLSIVPDALVGRCWPAVFAAIGAATTDNGFPVIEGLLSLVHLDHAARLLKPLPREHTELVVTATSASAPSTPRSAGWCRSRSTSATPTGPSARCWRSASRSAAAPAPPN